MKKTATILLAVVLALPVWAQKGSHHSTSHHKAASTTTTAPPATAHKQKKSHSSDYYTNVDGHKVHRPMQAKTTPSGATAQCGDGSYSFSQHRQGTCSHHGGVQRWITQ